MVALPELVTQMTSKQFEFCQELKLAVRESHKLVVIGLL